MSMIVVDKDGGCRLIFGGSLTFGSARDIEEGIQDVLRRHTRFEVDLAGVEEVDLYGLHIVELLRSHGEDAVTIVAGAEILEQAQARLLPSRRSSFLRVA